MKPAIIYNCQRHLRISFFLTMWMFSYVQLIDQLRLDLFDLKCKITQGKATNDKTNH